jgi:hypothetical protein
VTSRLCAALQGLLRPGLGAVHVIALRGPLRLEDGAVPRAGDRPAHLQARRDRPDREPPHAGAGQGPGRRQGRAPTRFEVRRPPRAVQPRGPPAVRGAQPRHDQRRRAHHALLGRPRGLRAVGLWLGHGRGRGSGGAGGRAVHTAVPAAPRRAARTRAQAIPARCWSSTPTCCAWRPRPATTRSSTRAPPAERPAAMRSSTSRPAVRSAPTARRRARSCSTPP